MNRNYIILAFVLTALALGAVFLYQNRESSGSNLLTTDFTSGGKEYTVELLEEGFAPQEITIKRGDKVRFVNKRESDFWPASNMHPTHGIYPEFDPRKPEKTEWIFQFNKAGEWRYHDHLMPLFRGTITVTD